MTYQPAPSDPRWRVDAGSGLPWLPWLSWLPWLLLLALGVAPMVQLAVSVAMGLLGPQQEAVLRALSAPNTLTALRHSLWIGAGGTLLAVLYGTAMALWVTLLPSRHRGSLAFAFVVQAMLPPQVVALAWLMLWLPLKSLLADWGWQVSANPLHGPGGMVLLLGLHYAPLVFLTVRAGLFALEPALLEAARVSGARPAAVLTRVVLPLLTPALLAGAALAFVSCVGNFGIPALLGVPAGYTVLPTLIYQSLAGFGPAALPAALAQALWITALAGGGLWLAARWLKPDRYRTTPRPWVRPPFALTAWSRALAPLVHALVWLLLLAPLAAMVAQSLLPAPGVPLNWDTVSLDQYRYVLLEHEPTLRALRNSMGLAAAAALLLAALSLLLLWPTATHPTADARPRAWLRATALTTAELAYALPGVVLAIAMLLLYLKPVCGLSVYNTVWILLLAYLARFFALQYRPLQAALSQLKPEWLEASRVFGAGYWQGLRRIGLPLLAPALAAGAMLTLLLAMNELTVSALLWSTGAETLGVLVFSFEQSGESQAAAVVGVIALALTLAVMALAGRFGRRLPPGVLPWRV